MYSKKLVSALLAGAMVMTSIQAPAAVTGKADKNITADTASDSSLVASYSFEDSLKNTEDESDAATAIVKGLGAYGSDVTYDDAGKEGKALKLDAGYGLKLNHTNLGKEYTVSIWAKPTANVATNQCGPLFLGYHNPEKWLGLAGQDNGDGSTLKWWSNDSADNNVNWKTYATPKLIQNEWNHVVIAGKDGESVVYINGEKAGTATEATNPLDGENQDIYVGVNNWDPCFPGLVDELKVYDEKLTEAEILTLYDPSFTPEKVLAEKGVSADATLNLLTEQTGNVNLVVPDVVKEAGATIAYTSDDASIATVAQDGTVTGIKAGKTKITATVKLGETTKTAETEVMVQSNVNGVESADLIAEFPFDNSLENTVTGGNNGTAIITGLSEWTGDVSYEVGQVGGAVVLGDYGIELNQKNIGKTFTVSGWFKPTGTFSENQCAGFFLGTNSPEEWIGMAGNKSGSNVLKFWGYSASNSMSHTTFATPTLTKDKWNFVTIVGEEGKTTLYIDGKKIGTQNKGVNPLDGENQEVYVGVNYWDPEFPGLADDVKIYNGPITEAEIAYLYETGLNYEMTEGDILTFNGIKADDVNLLIGEETTITPVLPEGVTAADVTYTYKSAQETVATVTADGKVKGVANGETTIAVTAKIDKEGAKGSYTLDVPVSVIDIASLTAEGEAVDTTYATESGKNRLEAAIALAKAAKTYQDAKEAQEALDNAIYNMTYTEAYADPFSQIEAPAATLTLKKGASEQLITIPDSIKDFVEVTYLSSDDSVATYKDGKVTALGSGKVAVMAIVTSNSKAMEGFEKEYTTAITIEADTPAPAPVPTPAPSVEVKPAEVGTTIESGDASFKVPNASAATPEIEYTKVNNKKAKSVAVPAQITKSGVTYKVTAVAANAFKNNKKIKSVTIPEGVKIIGKNAFYGCKNLKKITVKSTVLKKVGKNALKGISKKAVIKVPKKQKKAYAKLFKKKGQASTVKVK